MFEATFPPSFDARIPKFDAKNLPCLMVHRVCQIFTEWIAIPAVTIVGRAPTLGLATLPGTENDDFPFFEVWKPSNVWFLASNIVILPTMGIKLIQNTSKRPTHGILTIRKGIYTMAYPNYP